MVPLAAQACGRPVAGMNGATGVYFREQTVESVIEGILEFEGGGGGRGI
jgi:hypothetical protein